VSNYFGPSFKVEVNGNWLAADISKNIQQISVTFEPDTMDTCKMTLVNAYPEMRWTHTSDADLFQEGSTVTIQMGYVDDMQPMFDGEITKISPSFPDSGTPVVEIEGHSRAHWLHRDKKTRTFQQMSDKQIAEKIAQDAGLSAQADDTEVQHDYVMQPNLTDLEFLRTRAARIHFEVVVEGKKLIFRKQQEADTKIYTLVWAQPQQGFGGGPNRLPLKNFTPVMNTLNQVSQVKVQGYDPATKSKIVSTAGQDTLTSPMGGSESGSQVTTTAFQKQRQEIKVSNPVMSQSEADQHAKALYNQRAMNFITGSGATIGVPDIRAGKVVELQGLGPRFSGFYLVQETTHTIGESGYETTFNLKRNSV
jgi:phage protein D